jgi:hypothetical protein
MVSYHFKTIDNLPSGYSPSHLNRLREDERAYVRARLRKDQGRSARERRITFRDVVNCFKDFKFFIGAFMYFGLIVPAYG